MDPGEADAVNEKGAGRGGAMASVGLVPCSICLEAVEDAGQRSTAKLLCGHEFHLDCIGSAFNAKGMMQCPNCRKIEKGDWLYANGCLSFRDTSVDDSTYDEDQYDLSYSEMSYEVHWCPFTRLAHVPSSFEEGGSPSISYHGLDGHHAVFSLHPASSLAHPCPYVAHLHPLQPSSSSSSQTSHAHSHPSSHVSGSEWFSVPPATMRATRQALDGHPRPHTFSHPSVIRLASRASTSSDSVVSPSGGTPQMEARAQDLYSAVDTGVRFISGARSSSGMRSLASRAPISSNRSGLYPVPSSSSFGQSPQDGETTGVNHFYAWERDRLTPFPLMPVERASAWWGSFHQAPRSSDTGGRVGSWHQHNPERTSSQGRSGGLSHVPINIPIYPFI